MYKHSYHRSIRKAPADVTRDNEDTILARLYPIQKKRSNWNLKIGDNVRKQDRFRKYISATDPKKHLLYSIECLLTIYSCTVMYKLKDLASKDIKGSFY